MAKLEGENNMLKRMFMESHTKNAIMQERMEKVMKTLYNMFMLGNGSGSGGNGLPALQNRTPVSNMKSDIFLLFLL